MARRGRDRLALLLDAAPDAVLVLDETLHVRSANRMAGHTFDLEPADLVGRSATDLFPDGARLLAGAVGPGGTQPHQADLVARRADGAELILEIRCVGVDTPDGRAVVAIGRDIGGRVGTAELLEADRARSDFLSRMSHELRTPLNSVLGFAQLLRMGDLDALQLEAVDQILSAGRHLLGLLDEVLDLERLNTGRLDVALSAVGLGAALREVLELVGPLAAARDVSVEVHPGPWGEQHVLADPQRLRQVLLNLVTNAIKYNKRHGRVWLECGGDGRTMIVRVRDTGRGIPDTKLDRIFTPFERLGAERSAIDGVGVGLSLSKQLVEAMGGAIGVESTPGEGSTFWVIMRATRPGAGSTGVPPAPLDPAQVARLLSHRATDLRRVLYVEDNDANRRLVERLLWEREGIELLTATRAEEGLALARLAAPDAVLLDLHLPDQSGEEVLRALRGNPATAGIPVIVVTADATTSRREHLLAAGAAAYLTKPLDVAELFAALDAVFPDRPTVADVVGSRSRRSRARAGGDTPGGATRTEH